MQEHNLNSCIDDIPDFGEQKCSEPRNRMYAEIKAYIGGYPCEFPTGLQPISYEGSIDMDNGGKQMNFKNPNGHDISLIVNAKEWGDIGEMGLDNLYFVLSNART